VTRGAGLDRLSVHEFCRLDVPLDRFLEACAGAGVTRVALLRANVEAYGLERALRRLRELGLTVTSLSAAGYWSTGYDPQGVPWTLADNLQRLDAAVALGTDLVVLAAGPLDTTTRDLEEARRRVAAGIAELWPHAAERGLRLALEPLHPIFCPTRSVVTSLGLALDMVEPHPAQWVGVAVDSYHVWWDPQLAAQTERAGERIFAVHVDDFVLPLPRDLRRRGLMGEGCIDLARFKALVDGAGYRGPYEVEVLNEHLSALPPVEAVKRIAASYRAFMAG
jgi:sugar phosphate isomerase/epimerase